MDALAWVDWDWNVAQGVLTTVTAIAAVVALVQARQTVSETKAMRREERIARLPELIGDLGEQIVTALGLPVGQHHAWASAHAARERLRAGLAALDRDMPACLVLTESPLYPASDDERNRLAYATIDDAVSAAMDEIVALLRSAARL